MNFRQIVRDYFTFSRGERKGIIILLVLIFLLAIANKFIFYFETPSRLDPVLFDSASHELGLLNDSLTRERSEGKLFSFNPNSIDSLSLDSLALSSLVKRNILKFRRKGGVFHSKEDFRKIRGITDLIYLKIEPYLLLENEKMTDAANSTKTELFNFDPNTTTDNEFLRLGFSTKQVATIRNYQNKGGYFKDKVGFFKLRGLRSDQKRELADFVFIKNNKETTIDSKKLVISNSQIELNSADTIQLKKLPGIGDKLSKRIVKYRDLLGGFYSVNQLKEVYGMADHTIRQIEDMVTVDVAKIKKLDVNFADLKELSKHPYLKKNLALQIVKFRTKYGSIPNPTILRDSMILNIDDYNRLKPYF